MKKYYLNYDENANINYCFLFALFCIAERNKKGNIYNVISYKNLKELSDRIQEKAKYNISASSISRMINNKDYKPYFTKSEAENKIILNTDFRKGKTAGNKFVVLSNTEIYFLLEQNNNQLNKYYLYLKYYCGYTKSGQIDSTAGQILSAIGYSANCGNNKNNLCKYNTLLAEQGFISIEKKKDERGFYRNIYRMSI